MIEIINAYHPACKAINKKLSTTVGMNAYEFEVNGLTYKIEVPIFVFDGASIPRAIWGVIGLAPHGIMDGPGLLHDFCYHYKGDFPEGTYKIMDVHGDWYNCTVPMSKATSDELLKLLCVYLKACGKFKASLVWSGVAAFGIFAWNSDDEVRKLKLK